MKNVPRKSYDPTCAIDAGESDVLPMTGSVMANNPEALFGGTRTMLALIEQIYSCSAEPERWPAVLEQIADAIGGDSLALFARFPESVILGKARISDEAWQEFAEYYAALNPIAPRCDKMWGDGEARYSHGVIADRELEKTEFYNDFFVPNGMHHVVGVSVDVGSGLPLADFSCQRSRGKGEFDLRSGEMLEVLAPHLRRALMMSQSLKELQDRAHGLDHALSAHDHVVFGVGMDGRIVFQSEGAERLLRAGVALRKVGDRIVLVDEVCDQRLQEMLRGVSEVLLADGKAAGGTMHVPREGQVPLDIVVAPLRRDDVLGFNRIVAMVTVNDPTQEPLSRAAIMKSLFRLTPVEMRVADLLLAGKETREAADALKITFETARFHVKRVLAKTGTKRQTDLVRRMMSLPGVAA